MTLNTVLTILVALAAVVWLGIRQTTWTPLSRSRAWRSSLVLLGLGVLLTVSTRQAEDLLTGRSLGALLIELLIGAVVGAAIGMIAHLRPVTRASLDAHARRRRGDEPPILEARNGAWGLVLWFAMIAARVGLGMLFVAAGITAPASPAAILVLLGVNRMVRTAVILARSRALVRSGALGGQAVADVAPRA